ncbi:leucyl/phenylalanyl-tRNA--protein transferase [Quadrisphaera sp. DSM 44207]|uniref:leucyl/phenylalanyl-tRNA--protein transferase n=1 Tax=Quadrisphaera sp. DSM 44207 TaxID=1881057 RepID=UPI000891BF3C|nr:leucyl/phenylalanyl-tRNA--protein transferase [Quadrisphaera sp. DSM 44207]SDQ33012.1 leucyl/phenylalanyl-tRNA--protein transferase [Quadrisphaera sp. DSM 44207]
MGRPAGPPSEPPPSPWARGLAAARSRLLAAGAPGEEVAGAGADLEPGTLLAAYRLGLFPMGLGDGGADPLGWWCPDPRGVLPLDALRVSRSLRRSAARFEVRLDTAFDAVVQACADPSRPGRWITPAVARAYGRLHRAGWAHSVETWRDGRLLGGLYGVAVGGLFAGESMFSRASDASKAALVALVGLLREDGEPRRLLDVQWRTDHLASLGVVEVPRAEYLRRLEAALPLPLPPAWGGPPRARDQGG